MTQQDNVQTIEELYNAFGRGDLNAVLNVLAEDVVWQHPRPADIPWGGEHHGCDAVAQFFIATNQHVNVEQFSPEQFVVQDDQVIVFGGRVYRTDWTHVFRLLDGRIVSFREYTDTATIIEALNTVSALPAPEPYRR
jgi:ketosteroid isomerase-like protein